MNTCDDYRELAALRLYDELEADDSARLERHLGGCAACAGFARELQAGLGRLAQRPPVDDLPAGWRAGLDAALWGERRRAALRSPLWIAAASFLAGAALSWSVARPPAARAPAGESVAAVGQEPGGFERASPPPRARDRGTLPLLDLYLRR